MKVRIAAVLLLALALHAAWLWQPERQVRLHQAHFLKAVERRKWDRMAGFIADNYSDQWAHDKGFVTGGSREVFRQFLFLTIEHAVDSCVVEDGSATVRAVVKIGGTGSPVAQYAMAKVNTLGDPFTFRWEKQSWQPWDWQLQRIAHPVLVIPDGAEM